MPTLQTRYEGMGQVDNWSDLGTIGELTVRQGYIYRLITGMSSPPLWSLADENTVRIQGSTGFTEYRVVPTREELVNEAIDLTIEALMPASEDARAALLEQAADLGIPDFDTGDAADFADAVLERFNLAMPNERGG